MVNELVANAYDHTGVLVTDHRVRVEVEDSSSARPAPGGPQPAGTHGRGLLLVARLTSAWGSTPHPPGETVWAHLTRDATVLECERW
ncbi:ATP-binding protein [Lentzea xinjiangensis]|uniref:ATP-binding protein n=1 Tax=Lentzea xinjiangensis TaxID=402600 RepID=UPI001160DCD3|nr:ATP-binding protein [Lentzea xinjiangensis]